MIILSRNKNKIQVDYKSDDMYKYFLEKNPEKSYITKTLYMSIIKEFMSEIFNYMIFTNMEFYMPARLGTIRIQKRMVNLQFKNDGTLDKSKLGINYRETLKLWEETYPELSLEEIKKIPDKKFIYHLNEHTDGYRLHFRWDKSTSNVKNQSAYRYKTTRTNKRNLARTVKEFPNLKYYE